MFRKIIAQQFNKPLTFECRSNKVMSWRHDLPVHIEQAETFMSLMFGPILSGNEVVPIRPRSFYDLLAGVLSSEEIRFIARYDRSGEAIIFGSAIRNTKYDPGSIIVHEGVHHLDHVERIPRSSSCYLAGGMDITFSLLCGRSPVLAGIPFEQDMFRKGVRFAEWIAGDGTAPTGYEQKLLSGFAQDIDAMNAGSFPVVWDERISDYQDEFHHSMFFGGINHYLIKQRAPVEALACLVQGMVLKKPLQETVKSLF